MAATRFDLEKFNGENDFYLWSLKMRAILIQQGLDSALNDDEESKSKKEKGEGSSGSDGDLRTINNKAHSTIILHLFDEVLREVAKEKTASGLWAKLEEIFLKKSMAKRLYIKRKLYTFSIKEGTIMKDHLDELNKLILDFENVIIILDDEDMALILLSSLPDTYEHFVDTLLCGRQTLTLKDVKNALESKDLKMRADGKDHSARDGLVAKAKTEKKVNKDKKNKNQKEKTDKKKKKRKCYLCQKEGHYIKDCFEKKKLEKLQKESSGKADVVSVDEGESEDADVLIATDKKSSVLLGNNLAYKVAGIGSVIIKMYDGTIRSLEQILKGGTVIMKYSRRNGLYMLNGSVVLPDVITNAPRSRSATTTPVRSRSVTTTLVRSRTVTNDLPGYDSEVVTTATYLVNKSPSAALHFKTPQGVWSGKPPDLSNLRVFGCLIYAHINQGKLEPKAVKGYFIGYPEESMQHQRVETELITHDSNEDKEYNFEVESSEDKKAAERDSKSYQKTHITSQTHDYQLTRDKERRVIKLPKRYKARLVVKGFTQKHGVNFNEVFSPVVKYSSIRVLLAITAFKDLELDQMDVKTAFLHGSLEEEILMDQPEGFIEEGTQDMVCLLKRSLSQYDSRLYFKTLSSGDGIYLLLYVDDMLITCKRREEIERLKMELNSAFEMKDLGTATRILGMQIVKDRNSRTLFLTQAVYVKRVLSRFEMSGAKPVSVPLSAHFRLSKLQEPEEDQDLEYMKTVPYSSAVGSIMYSMVCTRPDVDHDGCYELENISLQSVVTLSTTEAEYIAFTEAVKEAKWLSGLVSEFGLKQDSVCIGCDSSSAIQLSKNPKYHERTKHIDVRLHFVRDEITNDVVNVVKVPTQTNPAYILTKAVHAVKFTNSLNLIGVDSL
ncbi:hypothetical protein KPL71_026196 [Citrus sinensis]|uniref:Uncharacterized protein n=1 Tax=Citrus sinensis TaxID=2711 RepID=A0ACB8HXP5_CITSI|nr:hypothetical protein KPL71_026196 [Citrus sinensis]